MFFITKSYCHLLACGHRPNTIGPIFLQAIERVLKTNYIPATTITATAKELKLLFLHLPYNPSNPTPKSLQKAFKENIIQPASSDHISYVDTFNTFGGIVD